MASIQIQKITLSALRDISFNKQVLTQSNVLRVRAGDGDRPGLRFHHRMAQSPGGRRRRRDRDPVGLRPSGSQSRRIPLIPVAAHFHPDCRTTSHAILSRQKRLFTFHIIAVSGEATLHADQLYVQACQPATGHDTGILFRTCQGRKDYHGGPNNFASLDLLNRPEDLARRITEACRV